ncbi:energy transducer TonB [Flavobacterium sp. CSZ]|uniref:energy transducer TonB n=1 Tax=Flavobacterium sp. CSZ TaxID=2783791 RepID=UPI00188D2084|nr:energy transducer TonB [Flavobacterium sp. CSZ]MBF4484694.1 energy transducer TonB [Flavobacterium sp. CSZ]
MEQNFKLTIPEPCNESWDAMTPKDNGRFCMNCSKTVIDFTTMLPEEVQHFFIQNQNTNICGRFKNSQLETITIQIPSRVLYTQTNYTKMFLLALFIAMGTTLFSCQDKEGNKNRIGKIEIVDNKGQNQEESETTSWCYGHQIESKKEKTKKTSSGFTVGMLLPVNPIETGSFNYDIIYNSTDLDILPVPEKGMENFLDFFTKNYIIPKTEKGFKGKYSIIFVIEKDGSLSNFNITKNTPKEIGEEAIRVLKTTPNWVPGKLKDKIVRSTYVLPITIK